MSRYDRYLQGALTAFDEGFSSKAGQKVALDYVSRAGDEVRTEVHDRLLSIARDDRSDDWQTLYYDFPAVHHWRQKHDELYRTSFPEAVRQMNELVELRNAIKAQPIVPPVKDATKQRVEAIRQSITDLMDKRRAQYKYGIALVDHFGKLPVSINAHRVINAHGTSFVRYFFYLAGKLTPLAVILAILDATKEDDR